LLTFSTDRMLIDYAMTDQYRALNAFHGDQIEHHIDIAANETRVGSTESREVKRDGNRLIYTTHPRPFSADGKMSVITLVWKKLN
jgi:hypothetical protein